MTVAAWGILLNAIIAVLLVVYGIWFQYVVRHQLGSKDAAIQALQTAITAKDAVIEQMEGEKAPAVAQSYRVMREHAEEMSAEKIKLAEEVRSLSKLIEIKDEVIPIDKLLDEIDGLTIAVKLITASLGPSPARMVPPSTVNEALNIHFNTIVEVIRSIASEQDTRFQEAKALLAQAKDKMTPTQKAMYLELQQSRSQGS